MNNFRLPRAILLAPISLGFLLCADLAQATLALDPSFGSNGIATVDIASGPDAARAIAVQADGALVLAGRSRQTVAPDTIDYVALARVDGITGALDATFGTSGTVTFLPGLSATNGGGGDGRAVVIQPSNQKILVTGTWKASSSANTQVFVARFDTDGVLDAGFGTAGVQLLTPAGVTNPSANAIALRSDGRIVVAGSGTAAGAGVGFVIVLDSDGSAYAGFTPAVVPNPLPAPGGADFGFNAVAVLSGNKVLAAGGGGDLTLAQFTSAGAPDTSFDGDGIASFNVVSFDTADGTQSSFDVIMALTVLDDGRLLIAGHLGENSTSTATSPVLARITSDGTLDATFGSGGFAPLDITGSGQSANGLGVRPSGDIVFVGTGVPPTQVSPDGIAVSKLVGDTATTLADLKVLDDGSVVAAGERVVSGANTAFGAVRLTATDLADGPDTVPNPFGFATQTGLEPGVSVTSNAVTITGIDAPSPISILGASAEYSIGCTTTFVSTPGTISNGQTVCVRTPAGILDVTAKFVQVYIGGVQGVFSLITGDATPDAFTFVDQTGVALNATITSNTITLTGINTRTDVSISGAAGSTYSVGCSTNFTAGVTRVDPGAQICVRHQSAATAGTVTTTTLHVGITTDKVSGEFKSTTIGDTTPNPFSFDPQTGVAKSTVITSNTITLTGFDADAPISVSGGQYSIGCTATFTATPGTVAPNATVCVRQTSSAVGGTAVNTTLTVGPNQGVSATFTSTTAGTPDTTPDPFSFVDQTNTPLAVVITSGGITIGGFDTNTTISVTGGTYSQNCATDGFTAVTGAITPNTLVCVRHTSASTGGTATNTVVTVGGVSDTFTSTTLPGDAVPNTFTFTDQTGVDLSTSITSAPVTITGIDIASPIAVTGGEYSIGCTSTFTSTAANISNGQTVCVRQTSSFNSNDTIDTTLTIGTVSGTFTTTTKSGDQTPDDFSFTSQANVALETLIKSNVITITGVDSPVLVAATGGPRDSFDRPLYGISVDCSDTFDDNNSVVLDPGATLCVGVVSAAADSTGVVVTVTIGGSTPGTQKSATFTVTTGETVPDQFTFTDRVGVQLGDTVYSDPVTITGITAPSKVKVSQNGQYQIDCTGPFTGADGVVSNGQTICVRQIAASSLATLTDTVLTVGGVSDTFTSTTTVDKPLPGSSAMDAWSLLLMAPLGLYRRFRSSRSAFRRDQ